MIIYKVDQGYDIYTDFSKRINLTKQNIHKFLNSFEKTLENFNIVPINPNGEEFDPELHEAVSTVNESGVKDNFVVKTLERGWKLNERVVKPALVIVNKIN